MPLFLSLCLNPRYLNCQVVSTIFYMSCHVAQWIRPWTLTCEVPGSIPLAAAVFALGQGTLSSLPSSVGGDLKLLVP